MEKLIRFFKIDPLISPRLKKTIEAALSEIKLSPTVGSIEAKNLLAPFSVSFISPFLINKAKADVEFRVLVINQGSEIHSFDQKNLNLLVDGILDDSLETAQVELIVRSFFVQYVNSFKRKMFEIGSKNLKLFEVTAKASIEKKEESLFNSEFLLAYAQSLVDLKRNLFHSSELFQMEKVLKTFIKNNFERCSFKFIRLDNSTQITILKNFLPVPNYKKEWLGIEMNWFDTNPINLIKGLFFYQTIVDFFLSKDQNLDPFGDEGPWQTALDALPFATALLSYDGEVCQHNQLFAKLGMSPLDCLQLQSRDQVMINNDSYNIFRKDVIQTQRPKILFVFFTESFFPREGESNLSPTGQELGIISSSIAHELNNPIAGILAAIEVLLLSDGFDLEGKKNLIEMKSGATRCKHLIDTFLGFSRANPGSFINSESPLSTINACVQQALNLLRFRMIESDVRLHLDLVKIDDFQPKINPSLLTMTFYLIFGELMTLYSHQLLLINKNNSKKIIRGNILESTYEIQIQLMDLNIRGLSLSKLIKNLLSIEGFVFHSTDQSLRFVYEDRSKSRQHPTNQRF